MTVQVYARLTPSIGELVYLVYRAVSKVIDHVIDQVSCTCLEFTSLSLSEVRESNVSMSCELSTHPYILSFGSGGAKPLRARVIYYY